MEPIAGLSPAEFAELRDGYLEDGHGADAPSLPDALELIRTGISAVLDKPSLDNPLAGARGELATLVDIATWALTMDRAAQETV